MRGHRTAGTVVLLAVLCTGPLALLTYSTIYLPIGLLSER